jgi:hypothetical protein
MVRIQFSAHPVLLEGQWAVWSVMMAATAADSTLKIFAQNKVN